MLEEDNWSQAPLDREMDHQYQASAVIANMKLAKLDETSLLDYYGNQLGKLKFIRHSREKLSTNKQIELILDLLPLKHIWAYLIEKWKDDPDKISQIKEDLIKYHDQVEYINLLIDKLNTFERKLNIENLEKFSFISLKANLLFRWMYISNLWENPDI